MNSHTLTADKADHIRSLAKKTRSGALLGPAIRAVYMGSPRQLKKALKRHAAKRRGEYVAYCYGGIHYLLGENFAIVFSDGMYTELTGQYSRDLCRPLLKDF